MVKKQRTPQLYNDTVTVPNLRPKDTDVKYTGDEPLFIAQPPIDERQGKLVESLNWYSRFYGKDIAKDELIHYCEFTKRGDLGKKIKRVAEREFNISLCWLARLHMRGLTLTETEENRLMEEIMRLTTLKQQELEEVGEAKSNRPNVQEIMRERTHEAGGELEGLIDEWIQSGARGTPEVNVVGILTKRNIMPQHVNILSSTWQRKRDEFQTVIDESDKEIVEGYRHFTKTQMKSLVKFCDAVLTGLNGYVNVKKASKAPRARKAVSPEKQTANLKFLKEFKELSLVSVAPAKIIGASEVFLYDTEKRKLIYLVADSHVGTLTVKGTTILGFDVRQSGVKTIRKPTDIMKKLMSAGKPASRKLFTDITTVQVEPTGRMNDSIIILKAY